MKLKLIVLILSLIPYFTFAQFQNPLVRVCNFLEADYNPEIEGIGGIGTISPNKQNEIGLYKNPALLNTNDQINGITGNVSSHFSVAGNYSSGIYFSPSNKFTLGYIFNYLNTRDLYSYFSGSNFRNKYYDYYQSLRASYSVSENLSFGIGAKHIHSNTYYRDSKINSYAIDFGAAYSKIAYSKGVFTLKYDLGADIQNIGPRVSYSEYVQPDYIPISLNLALGLSPRVTLVNGSVFGINGMYQLSKLLVPTPPIYSKDEDGVPLVDETGEFIIESGKDPDVPVLKGMLRSFYDAPGGTEEELNEIMHRVGIEAWMKYKSLDFALRYGRFFEDELKGNRDIRSLGLGLGFYNFKIDYFSSIYLNNNFDNTWGISFGYMFRI